MFPQPISWPEPEEDPNPPTPSDLVDLLRQQITAGFPPALALDLVLNELVVRTVGATRARSAAVALVRGDEMVCRAATGEYAPDLGVPLNTRDGLSGACLHTRKPQLSLDTESDPRVDAEVSRHLGIRSMLVVPVLEGDELVGVLEVFSPTPAAFSEKDQRLLDGYARDCARIRRAAMGFNLQQADEIRQVLPELLPFAAPDSPIPRARPPYEIWTVILGTVAILLIIGLSLMIGARIGWLRQSPSASGPVSRMSASGSDAAANPSNAPATRASASPGASASRAKASPSPDAGALVVYDQGKVVFRMKPSRPNPAAEPAQAGTGNATPSEPVRIWLAPEAAEGRLRHRVEPEYPADALAAHRSGEVVLEVLIGQDGAVSSVRTLSGDPLLAEAATAAVRNWRYEPYRLRERPAEFLTDVTLRFALPD